MGFLRGLSVCTACLELMDWIPGWGCAAWDSCLEVLHWTLASDACTVFGTHVRDSCMGLLQGLPV